MKTIQKNYSHISDCWEAIRKAETIEEVEELFEEFPRWSGDWEIWVEPDSNYYTVANMWYDEDYQNWDSYWEELDIRIH